MLLFLDFEVLSKVIFLIIMNLILLIFYIRFFLNKYIGLIIIYNLNKILMCF